MAKKKAKEKECKHQWQFLRHDNDEHGKVIAIYRCTVCGKEEAVR